MKHSRISLVERAAEVYDFAAALRAPAPVEAVPERALPVEPVAPPRPAPERAVPRRGGGAVAAIDRAALAESGYIVPDAAVTGLAEEFRLIKRTLLAGVERRVSLPEEKRRSVLVTSAQSGDGKSFCAINLALSLAGEREVKVLLVDGDFAKPEMLSILGIEDRPGLVDALADPDADPEDFVVRTDVPGLSVMPAGAKANDVPELLASERTRAVLARLAAADPRRIILFDSSPALVASPAAVLAGCVGQALVVVRADRTTEADLRETIGLLSPCDHVGLILNAAGVAVTGRKYGSYEGYGDDG
jgi:exopolysaccharide/PEP-CTERM locus tyrosine autokinase